MSLSRWCGAAAAVFAATVLIGCGGGGDKAGTQTTGGGATKAAAKPGKLEPIEAKEVAVLKGRVTYDGTPPAPGDFAAQVAKNDDAAHCNADPSKDSLTERTWVVSKDGGVANVAVWLLPGDGKYFKLPENKTWPEVAFVDQPYCAFEPYVAIHFPGVYKPGSKDVIPSGQKMELRNSAPIAHNSNFQGNKLLGIDGNVNLAPKEVRPVDWPPHTADVVRLSCNRHPWMRAYVWSLPTPYYAVTDKDGNFEIKDVPAGVDLKLVFWHPGAEWFAPGGAKGDNIKLNPGENTKDMKVKAK